MVSCPILVSWHLFASRLHNLLLVFVPQDAAGAGEMGPPNCLPSRLWRFDAAKATYPPLRNLFVRSLHQALRLYHARARLHWRKRDGRTSPR